MGLRAAKIDTLSLAKELENAGIPRLQAEAQIQTTIKVINMTVEEQLVTKHDLTHALHRTEEKLLAKFSKLEEADQKLSEKIDNVEEKLSVRIDKLDEKFSTEFKDVRADIHKLDKGFTELHQIVNNLSTKITLRLGSIITVGLFVLGAVLKFKI